MSSHKVELVIKLPQTFVSISGYLSIFAFPRSPCCHSGSPIYPAILTAVVKGDEPLEADQELIIQNILPIFITLAFKGVIYLLKYSMTGESHTLRYFWHKTQIIKCGITSLVISFSCCSSASWVSLQCRKTDQNKLRRKIVIGNRAWRREGDLWKCSHRSHGSAQLLGWDRAVPILEISFCFASTSTLYTSQSLCRF